MSLQGIIVLFIILLALSFVGMNIWRKVKAFSPKSQSCGTNCGCSSVKSK